MRWVALGNAEAGDTRSSTLLLSAFTCSWVHAHRDEAANAGVSCPGSFDDAPSLDPAL
jgi:hypothetical protein